MTWFEAQKRRFWRLVDKIERVNKIPILIACPIVGYLSTLVPIALPDSLFFACAILLLLSPLILPALVVWFFVNKEFQDFILGRVDAETPPPVITSMPQATSMPVVNGTVLAWRLDPPKKATRVLRSPQMLVVGAALVLLSIPAVWKGGAGGIILAVAGLVATRFAFGTKQVPIKLEPLPKDPVAHRALMKALRHSPDALEREHVYIGTTHKSKGTEPVLVHEKLLQSHTEIEGATRSGKNIRGAIPITMQLLGFDDLSFIHIDMKGDRATFQILKQQCEENGVPFYYYSLSDTGHLFNILNDPAFTSLSSEQKAEILSHGMSVTGKKGGQSDFFGTINERTLKHGIEVFEQNAWPFSFAAIHEFFSGKGARGAIGLNQRDFEFSSHVLAQIEKAAKDPRLNWNGSEPINPELFENAITVEKLVGRRGFFYVELSALLQPSTAAMLAVVLTRVVIAHLLIRPMSLPRVRRIYFMFDEAQEGILEPSMRTPLKQGSQFGASYMFGHQDMSDLKRDGVDLTDLVVENTGVKIFFTTKAVGKGSGRDYIANTAGERLEQLEGESVGRTESPTGESVTTGKQVRQQKAPLFGQNEIMELNLDNNLAYFEAMPRSGYTCYKPGLVEIPYPFTQAEFDRYESFGWPEPDGVRTVRATDIPKETPTPAVVSAPKPVTTSAPEPTPSSPPAPKEKRPRPSKPADPEQKEREQALAERMRDVGKKK